MRETGESATSGHVCDCFKSEQATRRDFLTMASVLGLEVVATVKPALADPASDRPKEGDVLVSTDDASLVPLEPKDISAGSSPVLAWPMDPVENIIRSGSRLNRVILLRLDASTLVGATKDRAADGVVAYSAICPHAGCEVNGWNADLQILECSCHYSHYDPREGAAVIDGPSPRPLAALPLKIVDGKIVVAKPFAGRVGIAPS